jgi:hypothetical protein
MFSPPPRPAPSTECFVCVIDGSIAILTGVRRNLNVVLIYISFMDKDVEHSHCSFIWCGKAVHELFCLILFD